MTWKAVVKRAVVVAVAGAAIYLVLPKLASVIPAADHDNQFGALPPLPRVPKPGNMVLGTVDGPRRIDRISQDVTGAVYRHSDRLCEERPPRFFVCAGYVIE
jgi:hypothetical protein